MNTAPIVREFHPKEQLERSEREVLFVLSVLYAPVSQATLAAALPPGLELKPLLESLQKRGLVETRSGRWRCSRPLVEVVTRAAAAEGRLASLAKKLLPEGSPVRYREKEEAMRDFRAAFYLHDHQQVMLMLNMHWSTLRRCSVHPLRQIALHPFDPSWMERLPNSLIDVLIEGLADDDAPEAGPFKDWLETRLRNCEAHLEARGSLTYRALVQGRLQSAEKLLDREHFPDLLAMMSMLRGDNTAAAAGYRDALKMVRRKSRRRKATLMGSASMLFVPALLAIRRIDEASAVVEDALADSQNPSHDNYRVLHLAVRLARGEVFEQSLLPACGSEPTMQNLVCGAVHLWYGPEVARSRAATFEKGYTQADAAGLHWIAAEFATLVARITQQQAWIEKAAELHRRLGTRTFLDAVPTEDRSQRALLALEQLLDRPSPAKVPPQGATRLIWRVGIYHPQGRTTVALFPREQKSKGKHWSAGRAVALKRLAEQSASLSFLTDADRRICACIECYRTHAYYRGVEYSINMDRALPHLVGHPLVFFEDQPERQLRVVSARPLLKVDMNETGIFLGFEPSPSPRVECRVNQVDGVLQIYRSSPLEQQISTILGGRLNLACTESERVRRFLEGVADQVAISLGAGVESWNIGRPPDLETRLTLGLQANNQPDAPG